MLLTGAIGTGTNIDTTITMQGQSSSNDAGATGDITLKTSARDALESLDSDSTGFPVRREADLRDGEEDQGRVESTIFGRPSIWESGSRRFTNRNKQTEIKQTGKAEAQTHNSLPEIKAYDLPELRKEGKV